MSMKVPQNDESFDDDEDLTSLVNRTTPSIKNSTSHTTTTTTDYRMNPFVDCCVTGIAFVQFLWIHHRTEFILSLILILTLSLAATGAIEAYENKKNGGVYNPKKHVVARDYSGIQSDLELKLTQIDHYCFDGSNDHCNSCEDPTQPSGRYQKRWGATFHRNKMMSKEYLKKHGDNVYDIDVIFWGDSNIEARAGTFRGDTPGTSSGNVNGKETAAAAAAIVEEPEGDIKKNKKTLKSNGNMAEVLRRSKKKFEKYFHKEEGASLNGLALGIAGDASPNLLWRIVKNENYHLAPKVWWISIGVNDLLSNQCSEEVTIMGVLRIVEELMHKNDDATIVINSILPVATHVNLALEGKYVHNKFWPAIKKVNQNLQKFAKKHTAVKFFNADEILTEKRGKKYYMKKDMFMDMVHLSVAGQEALLEAQSATVAAIIVKKEADSKTSYRDVPGSSDKSEEKKAEENGNGDGLDEYGYPMDDDGYDDFLPDWNSLRKNV